VNHGLRLILASESPRRKSLLESAGITPVVVPPNVEEDRVTRSTAPGELVRFLARKKVLAVASRFPGDLVLGGDTIVFIDGTVLGKPKDENDARDMLRRISGRTHWVYTGVALYDPSSGAVLEDCDETAVTIREMDDQEIDWYVRTGEPMDKAGSYALQGIGGLFVTRVEGDFTGVVGLPLPKVYGLLRRAGVKVDQLVVT